MKTINILNFIKSFDYFGETLNFTIQKKRKYQTLLGGVLYLLCAIFVIIIAIINFVSFCQRKRFSQSKYITNKNTNDINLSFQFGFNIDGTIIDSNTNAFVNYFDIFVYKKENLLSYTINDKLFSINDITISNAQTLRTLIQIKNGLTSQQLNDLSSYLTLHDVQIEISYDKYYIDMSSYSQPIKSIKENIKFPLSYEVSSQINIDAINEKFNNDANIIITKYKSKYFTSLTPSELSYTMKYRDANSNMQLASINIIPKGYVLVTERTYEKLLDFIAWIVSLALLLFYLIHICLNFYINTKTEKCIIDNSIWYKDKIIPKNKANFEYLKDLFNERKNNINAKKDNEILLTNIDTKRSNKKEDNEDESASQSDNNRLSSDSNITQPKGTKHSSKKPSEEKLNLHCVNNYDVKIIPENYIPIYHTFLSSDNLKNKFTLSNSNNFNKSNPNYFCCLCSNKKKNEKLEREKNLFNLAKSEILSTIDVINFLKKMREIDIMKYALFTLDEIKIVQFLTKPSYSLSLNRNDFPLNEMEQVFDFSKEKIEGLYNSFEKVYNDEKSNKTENLLKLSSYELYQLIQN